MKGITTKISDFFSSSNTLVILLSIYAMFACIFQWFVNYNDEVLKLIQGIDFFTATILFIFFFMELFKSKNKRVFMRYGWILLLSALPAENLLSEYSIIIRAIRLVLLIWLLYSNKFKSTNNIQDNHMIATMMVCVFIIIISTILILQVENVPEGKIKTAEEAIYWAIITISTVGYGDLYPVTTAGRGITIILLFSGVSVFISAAGSFSSWINKGNNKNKNKRNKSLN